MDMSQATAASLSPLCEKTCDIEQGRCSAQKLLKQQHLKKAEEQSAIAKTYATKAKVAETAAIYFSLIAVFIGLASPSFNPALVTSITAGAATTILCVCRLFFEGKKDELDYAAAKNRQRA